MDCQAGVRPPQGFRGPRAGRSTAGASRRLRPLRGDPGSRWRRL